MSGAPEAQRPAGAARLRAVACYAAEVVGCAEGAVDRVERFVQANRHAVYRVSFAVDPADVVVRLSLTDEQSERGYAAREAEVLAAVGPPAAPELLDVRITSERFAAPVLCICYVTGDDTPIATAPGHSLEALGAVVAHVHETDLARLPTWPIPDGGVEVCARARLDRALDRHANTPRTLPGSLRHRLDAAVDHAARRARAGIRPDPFDDRSLRLLHADLGPENVVWGASPVLIDWEYSRIGDPADEIAYLFDQNGLDAPQRDAFLRGYRADDGIAARVGWWEPVTLLGSLLWWVDWWLRRTRADAAGTAEPSAEREADYYLDHVARRLGRLEQLIDA